MKLAPILIVPLAAAALASSTPTPAKACGGFFCSSVPVDQTGEQILFGMNGGKITATIAIDYQGEAEQFSWLLPVASKPEITLGSQAAFTNLGYATQPRWNLQWNTDGQQCNYWWFYPVAEDSDTSAGNGGGRDVNVLATKEVGPFETVVLESSSTDDLLAWLDDNGYDQPPETRGLIAHYVAQDMVFVALRLQKNEPTGAIQPITLTFDEAAPCVPLVLTQVAAQPDMPVQIFLASDHRVVPTNWMHVTLNEKKINWLDYGSNYKTVVTDAIDEASGHGFVTEYAGTSAFAHELVYREGQFDLAALAATTHPEDFVMKLLQQGFPRDSQMQGLLRKHIPMPASLVAEGVTEQQFYNDLGSYTEALAAAGFVFDPAAFVADLEERVVEPLRATQAMLDGRPYFTRLYTTVSPDEMTRDPIFAENADLPDVSNVHTATATPTCGEANQMPESIEIALASGETFTLQGPFEQTYPIVYPDPAPDEPNALKIELIGATGAGSVVHPSQVRAVDFALDTQTPDAVLTDLANGSFPITHTPGGGGAAVSGGCSQGGTLGGLAAAISAIALLFRRRR